MFPGFIGFRVSCHILLGFFCVWRVGCRVTLDVDVRCAVCLWAVGHEIECVSESPKIDFELTCSVVASASASFLVQIKAWDWNWVRMKERSICKTARRDGTVACL